MLSKLPKLKLPSFYVSIGLYAISVVFLAVSVYNFYFSTHVLPGVYINEHNFGLLSKSEAHRKISEFYSTPPDNIEIKYASNNNDSESFYNISLADLDFKYDIGATYLNLNKTGRESFFTPLKYIFGFFKPIKKISPSYSYDVQKLNSELASFAAQKYPAVSNAQFILNGEDLVIQEAKSGVEVNLQKTKQSIDSGFSNYIFVHNVEVTDYTPVVFSNDLEEVRAGVKQYLLSPLVFEYKNIKVKASKEDKIILIDYSKTSSGTLKIVPNKYGIVSYLNVISSKIDIEAKGTQFEVKESGDIFFNPPVVGLLLDKEKLQKDLRSYIEDYNFGTEITEGQNIALNVSETVPDQDANDYGIKELIAEGVSYFSHSAANRVSNIATASQKIKGTLVAPGENFSFNDAVGPIDIENGFNTAYVISKGRTVLGTGGGVCQVSTTVFRAALNAGFPIVKRTAHAYRVSYYEEKSPLGQDATIYQPSVDFIFKNDLKNYILVYTVLDIENSTLSVKIYGTKDNREVSISDTKMLSEIAPPDVVYIDDPSLPKGTLIQEEWPAWGANTVFTRTVKKDGKVLYDDEFKSYYVPWAALYRRGV